MVIIDEGCSKCKYFHKELLHGWEMTCDAYPEGIPNKIVFHSKVKSMEECASGYKWEPREEDES